MYKIENGDIKSTANRIERAQTILNMKWPKHEETVQNEGDNIQLKKCFYAARIENLVVCQDD